MAPAAKPTPKRSTNTQRAEAEAYIRGQESARTDAHLREHDQRLSAINGSIDKTSERLGVIGSTLGALKESFTSANAASTELALEAKNEAHAVAEDLGTLIAKMDEDKKEAREERRFNKNVNLALMGIAFPIGLSIVGFLISSGGGVF